MSSFAVDCSSDAVFSLEELSQVRQGPVPRHIAIVMDGNRRWARQRGLPDVYGHWKGAEAITKIVRQVSDLGVEVLTLYSFSTENWARSQREIDELMKIFCVYIQNQTQFMIEDGVKLESIGDLTKLPSEVQQILEEAKRATAHCNKITLVLAMNYGARDEIRRAVAKITEQARKGVLVEDSITEKLISSYLDTANWCDPDLLIRTSGEFRLSNFLLWQISYAEVYITKVLWPDFGKQTLLDAIREFQTRERRLGGS